MAAGLIDPPRVAPTSDPTKRPVGPKEAFIGGPQAFNKIIEEQGTERQPPATHPNYLPVWDPNIKYVTASHYHRPRYELLTLCHRYSPLEPFTHYEHGRDADPKFPNLFTEATTVTELTPSTGSEVRGIQLSALTKEGKDQLALFTAQRKVVGNSSIHSLPHWSLMPVS